MTSAKLSMALLVVACAFSLTALVRWSVGAPTISVHPIPFGSVQLGASDSLDDSLADAEDFTVFNDPFRLANAPSGVRFDAKGDRPAAQLAVVASRPHLSLKAIIGPPWQAVVDGIPGQPAGTMVRTGARFDKLVARVVTRDSVIIQGADTTWILSFGSPR